MPTTSCAIFAEVQPQQNVGRQGADIQTGQVVVRAGERLNSSRIGALAAVGTVRVECLRSAARRDSLDRERSRRCRARALKPGQIYDINRFTLAAVVSDNGGIPIAYPPAPDTLDALVSTLDDLVDYDIVVFSGGSSVGERDLIRDAIAAKGKLLFHGVAVKPGKPTGLGVVNGKPVFAMPGYPDIVPVERAHAARADAAPHRAPRAENQRERSRCRWHSAIASASGRHQFYTVRIENGTAVPAFKASGDITSMSRADGYIEIPANVDRVEAGTPVDVTLF